MNLKILFIVPLAFVLGCSPGKRNRAKQAASSAPQTTGTTGTPFSDIAPTLPQVRNQAPTDQQQPSTAGTTAQDTQKESTVVSTPVAASPTVVEKQVSKETLDQLLKPQDQAKETKKADDGTAKAEQSTSSSNASSASTQSSSVTMEDLVESIVPNPQNSLLPKGAENRVKNTLDQEAQDAEKSKDAPLTSEEEKVYWDKLIDYAIDHGEKNDRGMGLYFSLVDLGGKQPEEAHIGYHFSPVGGMDSSGGVGVSRVEAIFEEWKSDDGNNTLSGDMWQYVLARTGPIGRFQHSKMVKKKVDGFWYVVDGPTNVDTTDAERDEKLKSMLNFWFTKIKNAEQENGSKEKK